MKNILIREFSDYMINAVENRQGEREKRKGRRLPRSNEGKKKHLLERLLLSSQNISKSRQIKLLPNQRSFKEFHLKCSDI